MVKGDISGKAINDLIFQTPFRAIQMKIRDQKRDRIIASMQDFLSKKIGKSRKFMFLNSTSIKHSNSSSS